MLTMSRDRLTPGERKAIEQAVAAGKVRRIERKQTQPARVVRTEMDYARAASKTPPPRNLPAAMSVRQALEWAFGTERAYFDIDEIGASSGGQRPGMSMEAILEQRFMLGTPVDSSPGRSSPAVAAEIIASVVRATLHLDDAIWVADLARAGITPDPMVGVSPVLQPVEWHANRYGWHGKTADARALGVEGWQPQPRRNRKGAIVHDAVLYTPCVWLNPPRQIAAARRRYLDWWGHLLSLQAALRAANLAAFEISSAMPPMTPWRKDG